MAMIYLYRVLQSDINYSKFMENSIYANNKLIDLFLISTYYVIEIQRSQIQHLPISPLRVVSNMPFWGLDCALLLPSPIEL